MRYKYCPDCEQALIDKKAGDGEQMLSVMNMLTT